MRTGAAVWFLALKKAFFVSSVATHCCSLGVYWRSKRRRVLEEAVSSTHAFFVVCCLHFYEKHRAKRSLSLASVVVMAVAKT